MKPTDSELRILQVLWDAGSATVREVHDAVAPEKSSGYTTTLKLMQIMTEKGLATRDTSSRTHIYSAIPSEKSIKKSLLDTFIDKTFKGSAATLVMQALGNGNASAEDLKEIKSLIDQLEKTNKS